MVPSILHSDIDSDRYSEHGYCIPIIDLLDISIRNMKMHTSFDPDNFFLVFEPNVFFILFSCLTIYHVSKMFTKFGMTYSSY